MALTVTEFGSKTLLEHQRVAIRWAMERESSTGRGGGLICDEMGLGKTITTLGLMLNNPLKNTLLLCPLAVVQQWIDAAAEAEMSVFALRSDGWNWVKGPKNAEVGIFITNSDKIKSAYSFLRLPWDRIVLDEAHQLRNAKGDKYKKLTKLKRYNTWCLTGTPLVNRLNDIGALLHLINPKIKSDENRLGILKGYMETYAIARTVEQLRPKLPVSPMDADVYVKELPFESDAEAHFYRGIQGALAEQLQRLMHAHDTNMTAVFTILLRLRQLSIHPQIYIDAKRRQLGHLYERPDWVGGSAKINSLLSLLKSQTEGHSWVVYTNFKDEMQLLKSILEQEECVSQVLTYSGELPLDKRTEVIQQTKNFDYSSGKQQVLLLQIHCGGTGLNLQHMDRIVFLSPWWTAALMDQAIGRVQRIGQTRKVEVHYLRLKETEGMNIDEKMFDKVEFKRELCSIMLKSACNEADEDDHSTIVSVDEEVYTEAV